MYLLFSFLQNSAGFFWGGDLKDLSSLLLNTREKLSLTALFKANDIHNTGIVRNAALPVICLHGDQQNSEDDGDANDNESDHGPRT